MSKNESSYEQVELKYCERCGGLFLRRQGSRRAYCKTCMPLMGELPNRQLRKTGDVRLPMAPSEIEVEGSVIELWAVAEVRS